MKLICKYIIQPIQIISVFEFYSAICISRCKCVKVIRKSRLRIFVNRIKEYIILPYMQTCCTKNIHCSLIICSIPFFTSIYIFIANICQISLRVKESDLV